MTTVALALPQPRGAALAAELELEGIRVAAVGEPSSAADQLGNGVEAIVVPALRAVLTTELIAACDRGGVRIVALGGGDTRLLGRLGLSTALRDDAAGWEVAAAIRSTPTAAPPPPPHRVIAVWGPQGSPGRSTVSIQLAAELTRRGRSTALVDADTVAPALALLLGVGDEAPGIGAACRRAEQGRLDAAELERLAATVPSSAGLLHVLAGLNRPSRWPELAEARLRAALDVCRRWTEETVVDVAGAFDADEELTYDVAGPRRHAATSAVLQEADLIVAVAAADPLGISRFIRDHAELRRTATATPIKVLVNKVRPGPLGVDPRGQVRRTLERFAGISDVAFLPVDQRSVDAALLQAAPLADVAPRSPLVAAVRRFAGTLSPDDVPSTGGSSRGSSRVARRLRSALAARGA